LPEDLF